MLTLSPHVRVFVATEPVDLRNYAHKAHTRRKLYDARSFARADAAEALALIKKLYRIERTADRRRMSMDQRLELRQRESAPFVEEFRQYLERIRPLYPPSSPLGKAITYATNQWPALNTFLELGLLPMDNNAAERALRTGRGPQELGVRRLRGRRTTRCDPVLARRLVQAPRRRSVGLLRRCPAPCPNPLRKARQRAHAQGHGPRPERRQTQQVPTRLRFGCRPRPDLVTAEFHWRGTQSVCPWATLPGDNYISPSTLPPRAAATPSCAESRATNMGPPPRHDHGTTLSPAAPRLHWFTEWLPCYDVFL